MVEGSLLLGEDLRGERQVARYIRALEQQVIFWHPPPDQEKNLSIWQLGRLGGLVDSANTCGATGKLWRNLPNHQPDNLGERRNICAASDSNSQAFPLV